MRLSMDLVYLPVGNYTIAFELYFSNKIDTDETTINAESGTLSVTKINSKTSSDHTRSIVNFCKAIVYPSLDDLDIDINNRVFLSRNYINNSRHLARKYAWIFCPWTLSVPRSEQFSENVARGKL